MGTYDTEAGRIKRQRAIADALRASGNEALPASIQTGGRFDAPVSGWQYANKALQQVLGAYFSRDADKSEAQLSQKDKAALADIISAKRVSDTYDREKALNGPSDPTDEMSAVEPLPNYDRKAALQAAVMRGEEFGGSSAPYAAEMTQREILPAIKPDYTLDANDKRLDGQTGATIATGVPVEPRESPEDRATMEFIASTVPDATPGELKVGRASRPRSSLQPGMIQYHPPTGGGGGLGETGLGLDEEALDNAARDIIRSGPSAMAQYVSRAAQDKPTRDALNNRATRIARQAGMTNDDVARFRSRVAGEMKSQKDLVGMKNAVDSYKKIAKFNGERLLQLVDGVDSTGVPALEGAIRYAKTKGGNVDAAEFASVLKVYQTEVARIVSQPRLVGQLTDSQIEEMQKVVSGSATAPQLRRVINRLNLEMDVRSKGIEDQVALSGGNMNIPNNNPPADPAAVVTPTAPADGSFSGLWK